MKPKYNAYAEGHRSGLEDAFRDICDKEGLKVGYETSVLPYVTSPQKRRYTPDWTISDKHFIETKGRFTAADRKKAVWIKEQHPDVRILYVFQRPGNTLSKASKTTYGDWCDKHELEWCGFRDTSVWLQWIRDHGDQPKRTKRTNVGLRYKELQELSTKKGK